MRGERAEKLFWFSGWAYDFSKIATVVLVIGLITHYFFYSLLVVRGESMEPNFVDGNVMLVDKISYRFNEIKRGDVVAMSFPGETEKRFIKRVIGLPGEAITLQANIVYINGAPLSERYLSSDVITLPNLERSLAEGEYFVLGDNRPNSSDSRAWGAVPESFIIGKAVTKLFSVPARADN